MWVILNPETGARLCKDNKWRNFAMFGTFKECVKTYKRQGNATNCAFKFAVNGFFRIICIHEGEYMNASGCIYKDTDALVYNTK